MNNLVVVQSRQARRDLLHDRFHFSERQRTIAEELGECDTIQEFHCYVLHIGVSDILRSEVVYLANVIVMDLTGQVDFTPKAGMNLGREDKLMPQRLDRDRLPA